MVVVLFLKIHLFVESTADQECKATFLIHGKLGCPWADFPRLENESKLEMELEIVTSACLPKTSALRLSRGNGC